MPGDRLVRTAEQLLEVGGHSTGDRAYLLGYYDIADGGGGDFQWEPDTTAGHNGGSIVVPTGRAGGARGRWVRTSESRPFEFKKFGAPADGADDATGWVQETYDACDAAGGGVVYPGDGIFLISDTVLVGAATRTLGAGVNRSIFRGAAGEYAGANAIATNYQATLAVVAKDGVSFEHITVDHQTLGTHANGIAFLPDGAFAGENVCTNGLVQRCRVLGATFHEYLIWTMRSRHMKILGNYVDGFFDYADFSPELGVGLFGQEGIEAYGGYDIAILYNTVRRIQSAGINAGASNGTDNCETVGLVVAHNDVEGCKHGVYVGTAYGATVDSPQNITNAILAANNIRRCYYDGVRVVTPEPGTTITGLSIVTHQIDDCDVGIQVYGLAGETNPDAAIAHHGIRIGADNVISGSRSAVVGGLSVFFMPNVEIGASTVHDSEYAGIYLKTLANCRLAGTKVDGADDYAILTDGCTDLAISDVDLRDYARVSAVAGIQSANNAGVAVIDGGVFKRRQGAASDVVIGGAAAVLKSLVSLNPLATPVFNNVCTAANATTTTTVGTAAVLEAD
jgi:hypothetical protein